MQENYYKIKETYVYTHNNISVYVKIDYQRNRIDLVEPAGIGSFKKKEYVFIGRGVEYMDGWVNILEAMQEAIKDAKKRYRDYTSELDKQRELELVNEFADNKDKYTDVT